MLITIKRRDGRMQLTLSYILEVVKDVLEDNAGGSVVDLMTCGNQ